MRKGKILIAGLVLAALIATTAVTWAVPSATRGLSIVKASSLANGSVAQVTDLGANLTRLGGKHNFYIAEMFRIDLGSPNFSDGLAIHLAFLNPGSKAKVLQSPNAWIEMQLWYPNPAGSLVIENLGSPVAVSQDTAATAAITTSNGDVVLKPSMVGISSYFILARIYVPGEAVSGSAIWKDFEDLKFYCQVTKL